MSISNSALQNPPQTAISNQNTGAERVTVAVKRLPHAPETLPAYATDLSAGLDLVAAISKAVTLQPGERGIVETGLAIALPAGFEAQIRPRSGLAFKHGLSVLNSPGTIDADYRGEVKVILANLGNEAFTIEPGMRIAQMVLARYAQIDWTVVETLDETARGAGGFGSTGTR